MSSARRRNNRNNNQRSHYNHQNYNNQNYNNNDQDFDTYFEDYTCKYSPGFNNQPETKNMAQTTLTLTQIASILVVVGSVIVSGFSAWSNINRELDLQKNNLETFKTQNTKDVDNIESSIRDLKKTIEESKIQTQKSNEQLDQRIQNLDTTVSQLYQSIKTK